MYSSQSSSPASDGSQGLPLQVNSAAQKRMQLVSTASSRLVPYGEKPAVPLDLMDIAGFNAVQIRQPALEAAVDALALVQLGNASKDDNLLSQAQQDYGRSLRLLSSYIADSGKRRTWDEQIASAIVVLKYCESFESLHHAKGGSIHDSVHHLGLRSFYLSRGPIPLKDVVDAFLFCQARSIILGGSFAQRRRCFLEDPEWIDVSKYAPGRDEFFELGDIAIGLPGLAELVDHCMHELDREAIPNVVAKLENFIDRLDAFAIHSSSSVWNIKETYIPQSPAWLSTNPSMPPSYKFDSWRSTNMFCTWNVVRMYALLELQRLHDFEPSRSSDKASLKSVYTLGLITTEIEQGLDNVCRSIPAQVGMQPNSLGIICTLLMLPTTISLLESHGRITEATWCKTLLRTLRHEGFR